MRFKSIYMALIISAIAAAYISGCTYNEYYYATPPKCNVSNCK